MSPSSYRTLVSEGISQLREKASRFLAIAFPIKDEEAFKERLGAYMKEHHGAKHFCSAWVLGDEGERHRANDAGEPSGTAGKPILNRIQVLDLTYCGVIVVRYFGGTLLGRAGLVQAYGEAAQLALDEAVVEERMVCDPVRVVCSYAQETLIRNAVLEHRGEVIQGEYGGHVSLHIALPKNMVESMIEQWAALGIHAERAGQSK